MGALRRTQDRVPDQAHGAVVQRQQHQFGRDRIERNPRILELTSPCRTVCRARGLERTHLGQAPVQGPERYGLCRRQHGHGRVCAAREVGDEAASAVKQAPVGPHRHREIPVHHLDATQALAHANVRGVAAPGAVLVGDRVAEIVGCEREFRAPSAHVVERNRYRVPGPRSGQKSARLLLGE